MRYPYQRGNDKTCFVHHDVSYVYLISFHSLVWLWKRDREMRIRAKADPILKFRLRHDDYLFSRFFFSKKKRKSALDVIIRTGIYAKRLGYERERERVCVCVCVKIRER
jgi:hypothetical protein